MRVQITWDHERRQYRMHDMGGRFLHRVFSVDLVDVEFFSARKGFEPRMTGELHAASSCSGDPVLPRVPTVDPIIAATGSGAIRPRGRAAGVEPVRT